MADKLQFQQKLSGILELAKEQNDRITTEEVETYFEEEKLSKEQMELVYDYLLSQKVVVKGYAKKGGTVKDSQEAVPFTDEEKKYLREYEEELLAIRRGESGERERLIGQAIQKDALAKGRLIELYLPEVVRIAKMMHHKDVYIGDMIQEGNVSLMLALDDLEREENAHEMICNEIRQGMQALIEEQDEMKRKDQRMVAQVNKLDEEIKSLTEDLGRKVTIEEVAKHMEMSEEEVLNILKLAGEDMEEDE